MQLEHSDRPELRFFSNVRFAGEGSIGVKASTDNKSSETPAPLGPRFWKLWGASTTSGLGDGLVLVGFPLLAATITWSPQLIAGIMVAERIPWLLLSLPAGALADRMDRRRLLAVVESAR